MAIKYSKEKLQFFVQFSPMILTWPFLPRAYNLSTYREVHYVKCPKGWNLNDFIGSGYRSVIKKKIRFDSNSASKNDKLSVLIKTLFYYYYYCYYSLYNDFEIGGKVIFKLTSWRTRASFQTFCPIARTVGTVGMVKLYLDRKHNRYWTTNVLLNMINRRYFLWTTLIIVVRPERLY